MVAGLTQPLLEQLSLEVRGRENGRRLVVKFSRMECESRLFSDAPLAR